MRKGNDETGFTMFRLAAALVLCALTVLSCTSETPEQATQEPPAATRTSGFEFLCTGENPVQTVDDPSIFDPERTVTITGKVVDERGDLSGVQVSIQNHPEFGHTETGYNGEFSIAVNGGQDYVVRFHRPGYKEATHTASTRVTTEFGTWPDSTELGVVRLEKDAQEP